MVVLEGQLEQARYEITSLRAKEQRLESAMLEQRESIKKRADGDELRKSLAS